MDRSFYCLTIDAEGLRRRVLSGCLKTRRQPVLLKLRVARLNTQIPLGQDSCFALSGALRCVIQAGAHLGGQ